MKVQPEAQVCKPRADSKKAMPFTQLQTNALPLPRPARWVAALMLAAAGLASAQTARRPTPPPKPVCLVADFRALALQTHDPRERAKETGDWLRANGSACTAAQLGTLASNRAAWLGNADSPGLMGMIDGMLESLEAKAAKAASAAAAMPAPSANVAGAASAAAAAPNAVTTAGAPPPRTTPAPAANGAVAPVVVPVVVPGAPATKP